MHCSYYSTHAISRHKHNTYIILTCTLQKYLGDFEPRFEETKATDLKEKLQSSLKSISGEIAKRNESLDMPYNGMLPGKIPNSITI